MTLTQLINLAESRLGFNISQSVPGATKQALAAARNYPVAARIVLRSYPWPEATGRATLDYEPGFPENLTNYTFQYELPSACLLPRNLNEDPKENFRHESGMIYCDYEEPTLVYTRDITYVYDEDGAIDYDAELEYSDTLAEAIIWKLCEEMAPGLAPKMIQVSQENYSKAYYYAINIGGSESRESYDEPALWTDV